MWLILLAVAVVALLIWLAYPYPITSLEINMNKAHIHLTWQRSASTNIVTQHVLVSYHLPGSAVSVLAADEDVALDVERFDVPGEFESGTRLTGGVTVTNEYGLAHTTHFSYQVHPLELPDPVTDLVVHLDIVETI